MSINWVLGHEGVTCSLMGATTPAMAEENAAAAEWELTPEEYAAKIHLYCNGTEVTATYAANRTITDNGDGTLTAASQYSGTISFTNTYKVPPKPPVPDTSAR